MNTRKHARVRAHQQWQRYRKRLRRDGHVVVSSSRVDVLMRHDPVPGDPLYVNGLLVGRFT